MHDQTVSANPFLDWVKKLIPFDKFQLFLSMFKLPVETVTLTGEIFDVLDKIFDGQDSADNLQFASRELLEDANNHLEQTEFKKDWRKRSMNAFKTRLNSIMIVDLPTEQTTERPEPYYYFLPLERVIDFESKGESINWLIFDINESTLAVLDNTSYRIFQKVEKSKDEISQIPISDNAHNLGYCPANWFLSDPVNSSAPQIKKSVLTDYLASLDKYLFFLISKHVFDMYAPYPLIWVFDEDCDYSRQIERGEGLAECKKGFLVNESNISLLDSGGYPQQCPLCQKRRLTGAGGIIKVPTPEQADGANLRQPMGIVEMGTNQLNYTVEECERRKVAIFEGVTGNILDTSKEAINEKQVMSLFESRKAVLLKVKGSFERSEKWLLNTIFKLRYDSLFIDCSVNYGSEFFLYDASTLLGFYESARAAQLDSITLDFLQEQYFATRYKNNREQFARVQIILNLDPFRHLSASQVQIMYEKGHIEYSDYILKVNFSSLLQKFERENILVTEFGKDLIFNKRIEIIKTSLESYIIKPALEIERAQSISNGIHNTTN